MVLLNKLNRFNFFGAAELTNSGLYNRKSQHILITQTLKKNYIYFPKKVNIRKKIFNKKFKILVEFSFD